MRISSSQASLQALSSQRGSLYSSLQCHLNRQFSETPFVRTESSRRTNVELTAAEVIAMQCCICQQPAEHFMNLCGRELLMCSVHAEQGRLRYAALDPITWFIRSIRPMPVTTHHHIYVMKTPQTLLSKYSGLPWLWLPSLQMTFCVYHDEHPPNWPPASAQKVPITKREWSQLTYQLLRERERKRSAFVIGFAKNHPFDQPDLLQGYSVGIHKCTDCAADHFEPYHFTYCLDESKLPTIDEKEWQTAEYLEFEPATATFSFSSALVNGQ